MVSVPSYTRPLVVLSLALNQYTVSNILKVAKSKDEMINAIDNVAKNPGNSLHDHDYHSWCVNDKGNVCNYSNATLS